jgi:hypothetical protein
VGLAQAELEAAERPAKQAQATAVRAVLEQAARAGPVREEKRLAERARAEPAAAPAA